MHQQSLIRRLRLIILWIERKALRSETLSTLMNPGPEDDVMELTRSYLETKRELDYKMEEWEKLNESLE